MITYSHRFDPPITGPCQIHMAVDMSTAWIEYAEDDDGFRKMQKYVRDGDSLVLRETGYYRRDDDGQWRLNQTLAWYEDADFFSR